MFWQVDSAYQISIFWDRDSCMYYLKGFLTHCLLYFLPKLRFFVISSDMGEVARS